MTTEPPPKEKSSSELTDEHLAELLKRDAKNNSLRYSTLGGLPRRPTSAAPKPNKRFLQNILRETDTHNAALKRKEELEARARLREIARAKEREEESGRRPKREEDYIGGLAKRRRVDDDAGENGRKRMRAVDDGRLRYTDYEEDQVSRKGDYDREKGRDRDGHRSRQSRRDDGDERDGDRRDRRRSEKRRQRSRSRHRSRSRSPERRSRHHRRHRRSSYSNWGSEDSRSPPRTRHRKDRRRYRSYSRSPSTDSSSRSSSRHIRSRRDRHRHRRRSSSPSQHPNNGTTKVSKDRRIDPSSNHGRSRSPSSSDPLSPLLGPPAPPKSDPHVRSRGRGAGTTLTSKMDMHFNPNYDPTTDIQPPSPKATNLGALEGDDWDLALEAHRDRQKWKQIGAERLKAAGFNEGDVKKWESGGEKTEENVVWGGKGQQREWDRGKEVD